MTPHLLTRFAVLFACAISLGMFSVPAWAYLGPGAGVSFIGSILSTLGVIVLVITSILFWPLRYAWKRAKRLLRETGETEPETTAIAQQTEAQTTTAPTEKE